MAQDYLFEVGYKAGMTDPIGKGLKNDIVHLGLGRVKNVSSGQLYKMSGQLSADERSRIAQDLLCDPIIQECRDESASRSASGSKAQVIDVWYKPGVTDVVGDSVLKGVKDLDISGVQDVRTGMRYHLDGITRREAAEKIALLLLVNPLVHDSTIHAD